MFLPIMVAIASPVLLSVVQTDPAEEASPAKAKAPVPEQRVYRIVAVGDVMMGSDWPTPVLDPRVTPDAPRDAVIGSEIADVFHGADVVFGNFEGTIHTGAAGAKSCSNPSVCFTFRSPPFHAAHLSKAGFNLMSNANNHARDFGDATRALTFENLTKAGIVVSSADQDGMRFGVKPLAHGKRAVLVAFGHNPGLMQVADIARAQDLIRKAESMGDLTIVSCHIGAEGASRQNVTRETELFLGENRGNPWAFAHAAVDAGADVVLCHGPHVPRAIQVYKKRFIAYSLGNFWTYGRFNLSGPSGLAPIADLRVADTGELISARIISARQDRPGGPYLDPTNTAAKTIARLTKIDIPESGLEISETGEITWAE